MIKRSYITLVKSTGCYKMQTAWNPACVQCNQWDFECIAGPGIFFPPGSLCWWSHFWVYAIVGCCPGQMVFILAIGPGRPLGNMCPGTGHVTPVEMACQMDPFVHPSLALVVVPFWDLPSPLELAHWLCPLEGSLGAHLAWVPWPWLAWLP